MKLRPYQEHWLDQIRQAHLEGNLGVVAQMPTGSGKTVAGIAEPCRRMAMSGRSVLLIVHRDELVRQTADKLARFGLEYGIIAAKFGKNKNPMAQIQIAMVKTLRNRLGREPIRRPRYIIMDECHLSGAKTYQDIIEHYKDVPRLGLSATPWRMDGMGFENLGTKLVMGPTVTNMNDLWRNNHNTGLVPARCYSIPVADLAAIRRDRRGEYDIRAAAMQYERQALVGGVVDEYVKHASDRKGIVFCTSIDHSTKVRDQFLKKGIIAEHLDGTTPKKKRAAMLEALESGETQVICNCAVLVEGLDITSISAISIAVPTRSLSKYLQMVGRAARPHPGKKDYIVLDHGGCVLRLGTPDYENDWSIATRERIPGAPRGVDRDILAKICEECRFANEIIATECAICGSTLMTVRDILIKEGMLVEVKPKSGPKKKYRQVYETHAQIETRLRSFVSRYGRC